MLQRLGARRKLLQDCICKQFSRGLKRKDSQAVLLRKDVEPLGTAGSLVKVAPGFARNYLFPNRLASYVTKKQLKEAIQPAANSASEGSALSEREAELRTQQQQLGAALAHLASSPLEIHRQVTSGSAEQPLRAAEIVEAARTQKQIDLSPLLLELPQDIVQLGSHQIRLRCFVREGVKAHVDVSLLDAARATQGAPAAAAPPLLTSAEKQQ